MTNLSCWNAAATLGATLAEWQRRREEEEAARRAAMFSSGGGDEEDENSDVLAKRRAKVIVKNQSKRNQEQAWEDARTAQKTQQMQNAIAKNNNLTQAEAEMGKVKPVTPYVAASYIDKDEEKLLKDKESQRAWAAAHAREEAKAEKQVVNDENEVDIFTRIKQYDPPSWLSVSGESGGELELFSDKFIGVTNINRGIGEILFYEEMNLKLSSSFMGIRNPNGVVDVNITNGDLTLAFGNISIFGNIFNATLGMITKKPTDDPNFYSEDTIAHDWDWNWGFSTNSIVTAQTNVYIDMDKSTSDFQVESRETIEGEIKTVKTGNILLVTGVAIATVAIIGSVLGGASIGDVILVGAGKLITEIGSLPIFGGATP